MDAAVRVEAAIMRTLIFGNLGAFVGGKVLLTKKQTIAENAELVTQWLQEKNGALTPDQVAPCSNRKVWWQCELGHSWQATIAHRVKDGQGCPVCAGRRVLKGFNDLQTIAPDVAKSWHPTLNGELTPELVTAGTPKRVWWQCEKGHEWESMIANRVRGRGCPICSGKLVAEGINDLGTTHPDLAEEWHPDKNGSVLPQAVTAGCNKKAWWRCKLGHEWEAPIYSRVDGRGCPYCAGKRVLKGFNDLQTRVPEIAMEWHPTLNGDLTPEQVTDGSAKYAWWLCAYGHVWKTRVSFRTGRPKQTGCPVCAGKVKQAKQRYYEALERESAEIKQQAKDISVEDWN